MVSIGNIRNKIIHDITDCMSDLGFTSDKDHTFYSFWKDTIHVVKICFLDRRHAAFFGSNTASFSLELGVFYTFVPRSENITASDNKEIVLPKMYECHIRGCMLRDFRQKPPQKILSSPDRKRGDIWWVDSSCSNLEDVLKSATRVIRKHNKSWLNKFSDLKYAYRYLRGRSGKNSWKGGPFNIGKKGCPLRKELVRYISMKLRGEVDG